jgi:hypothetical protein
MSQKSNESNNSGYKDGSNGNKLKEGSIPKIIVVQPFSFYCTPYCFVADTPASKLISFIVVSTISTCSLYLFSSHKDV